MLRSLCEYLLWLFLVVAVIACYFVWFFWMMGTVSR